MGVSKVGERYGVSIGLQKAGSGDKKDLNIFNDAAIPEFSLDIPVNQLPSGRARLVGKSADIGDPNSGTYGVIIFQGVTGMQDANEYPIYINTAVRTQLSQDMSAIDITFTMGGENVQEVMEPFTVDGTSVEAMKKVLTVSDTAYTDYVSPSLRPNSVSDNMTWRFVGGNVPDHLSDVVEHAALSGDILYWSFDDVAFKFRLGTFNVSKASKFKNFFMYTSDAITPTSGAVRRVKGCDCDVWYYAGYSPSDLSGGYREARSPNMIIDSTAAGSGKDTGVYSKECWTAILDTMGASDDYKETGSYGRQYVVKPFPSNTHKSYSITPFVRNYMLAEYSKMVRTNLYNHPGPAVGSCVHFYAASAQLRNGDFLPDDNYTARYIVVGKRISKSATTSAGLLGETHDTTTADMVTELTMVSNCGYAGTMSPDYKQVIQLSESIARALSKEKK